MGRLACSVDQARTSHWNKTMNTTIEKDSPVVPLLILAVMFLVVIGCGLGLAYAGGVFTGKNEVIANDQRITHQNSQMAPAR